ncbi:MAG: FtsB/FtsL family cell division protein [Planctomycetota bacterium]
MGSSRKSIRDSIRRYSRDYSLIVVAGALLLSGLAVSKSVIPNYHEMQQAERRNQEIKADVAAAQAENDRLKDQIEALEDPYYIAEILVEEYKYRYPEPGEVDDK